MWTTPTTNDVMTEFTPSEAATIDTLLGGSGPVVTRLAAILGRAVAEIRGYIDSGGYAVDTQNTSSVPQSMMTDAIALTRWRFLISAPQLKQLQTEERKGAALDSILKLKAVASQNFVPDPPTGDGIARAGMWNSENKIIMRTHPVTKPATQWTPQTDAYANPCAPADAEAGEVCDDTLPPPDAGVFFLANVTTLRGEPTSLEAVQSVGYTLLSVVEIILSDTSAMSMWQLVEGPADGTDPNGQVAPLDYDPARNNVHWVKVGGL